MRRLDFIQKMTEYLEVVETAKAGEDVRDAITKALITIDTFNVGMATYPMIIEFKPILSDALDLMWEDVESFYPSAVRPALPPAVDPAIIMSDELEDILKRLMNSVTGSDMRSAIFSGCQNVYDNIVAHNFVMLYYLKAVDDLFSAFIEACDDEEKRTAALDTRSQWHVTDIYNKYQQLYNNASQLILQLSNIPTGGEARPVILDVLTGLKDVLLEEISDAEVGQDPYWDWWEYPRLGESFEMIANVLIDPTEFTDFRYIISAGGPYATQGEAESRYTQVVAIDTKSTYNVVDLFNDEHRGFYVILNYNTTDDGWYLTYAGANARAAYGNREANNRGYILNLTVLDSKTGEVMPRD